MQLPSPVHQDTIGVTVSNHLSVSEHVASVMRTNCTCPQNPTLTMKACVMKPYIVSIGPGLLLSATSSMQSVPVGVLPLLLTGNAWRHL